MEGTILKIEIEQSTRQWLGVVILGGVIAAMMFTGLIPAAQYQKYTAFVLGAFFYHVIRMLNDSKTAPEIQQQMHSGILNRNCFARFAGKKT